MEQADLYDMMFKRRSIRKFEPAPLDEATRAEISAQLAAIKPLYEGIRTEMKIVPPDEVKGMIVVKAPHFITLFSETKDGYQTNAGFLLEQMDLYLSARGIGCCWQGLAKPTKELSRSSELEFVIMLAFGRPAEQLHRGSVAEFKREPLDKVRTAKGADDLLEPARLAPSAMNKQNWFFTGGDGVIHAYTAKTLLPDRYGLVDLGIAICHIWTAARHFGKQVEFFKDPAADKTAPSGKIYALSLRIR